MKKIFSITINLGRKFDDTIIGKVFFYKYNYAEIE